MSISHQSGHPARACERCDEWLPHFCAAEITITREKWTGRRVVTIRDRQLAEPQPLGLVAERLAASHRLLEQATSQAEAADELEAG
jgi:hypothetical protein